MDVLIVGAGPTGLTAALELARHGILATLIDRKPEPSSLSRAVGILPSSMKIFEPSGVAAKIDAEAVRFDCLKLHDGTRLAATLPLNFDARSRLWGLAQDRTEHHLADAFAAHGGTVRFGTALEDLRLMEDGRVEVRTTEGISVWDRVIGADGVHSTVRTALEIGFEGYDLPQDWSIADVDCDDWHSPESFCGYMIADGDVAIVVPLEPTRFRVIASRADALAALPVPMNVRNTRRTGAFTISVRQATAYRKGAVFLAGDAAHCHSPAGGRGMNLGIADAADLARRIAEGREDGYEAARIPVGTHVLKFTERARRLVQTDHPLKRRLTLTAIRAVAAVPPLARLAAHRFINA
ncbi:FAD-dependent oxidoreductase [Rhodobacterales bacterium HKCCE3408]|nr:FAD-dependent oxidoreductase [Rhodobacterales bacterium HKCCE3408]